VFNILLENTANKLEQLKIYILNLKSDCNIKQKENDENIYLMNKYMIGGLCAFKIQ